MVALTGQLASTRLGISLEKLAPDPKRLNPLQKLSSIPRQNAASLAEALVFLPVLAFAVWKIASENWGRYAGLTHQALCPALAVVTGSLQGLSMESGVPISGDRLPGFPADTSTPQSIASDDQAGSARRAEGNRRQSADESPGAANSARYGAAQHDEGDSQGHCSHRESDALLGRHPLRDGIDGGAAWCSRKARTIWRGGFARLPSTTRYRWSRTSRWRRRSTNPPKSARKSRRTCIGQWPKCWPTSSSSCTRGKHRWRLQRALFHPRSTRRRGRTAASSRCQGSAQGASGALANWREFAVPDGGARHCAGDDRAAAAISAGHPHQRQYHAFGDRPAGLARTSPSQWTSAFFRPRFC